MADQWWMGYLVRVVRVGFIYTCNMIAKNHPCALDGCVNRGGDWRQRCGSDICVCVSVCVSGACVTQRYNWPRRPAGGNKPNLRVFSFSDAFRLPINVRD